MPGVMESPDPVSMLSTDPLLREKLSREMTHQNFQEPEQVSQAKMIGDWLTGPVATDDYGNEVPRDSSSLLSTLNSMVPHPGQSDDEIAKNTMGYMLPTGGAGLVRDLASGPAQESVARILAYHGTPHRFAPTEKNPLGEFDASKIGSGEGAQAYGHGLYFAENPGVAQEYARRVTGGFRYSDDELKHMEWRLANAKENAAKGDIYAGSEIRDITERLAARDQPGVYKADIPDEHIAKMLDWDKPLGQQTPEIREAIAKADPFLSEPIPSGGSLASTHPRARAEQWSGEQLYQRLARLKEKDLDIMDPHSGIQRASNYLRQAGIPGIRYLDQGSRGAGQGTSNFVLFDPTIANILERME